jgi:hypothetical protein
MKKTLEQAIESAIKTNSAFIHVQDKNGNHFGGLFSVTCGNESLVVDAQVRNVKRNLKIHQNLIDFPTAKVMVNGFPYDLEPAPEMDADDLMRELMN